MYILLPLMLNIKCKWFFPVYNDFIVKAVINKKQFDIWKHLHKIYSQIFIER